MSNTASRRSLRTRLYMLAAGGLLGLLVFGFVAINTLDVVKVNGPYYRNIVQGKDVIADILPPPEYIIESYLVALQMRDESNPPELAKLIARGAALQEEYRVRHEYWQQDLAEGEMKTKLLVDSYQPAMEFYRAFNERYVPALQKGDTEAAAALLRGELAQKYQAHRSAIDQVVAMATQRNQSDEQEAREVIRNRIGLMLGIGGAVAVGIIFSFAVTARRITKPINQIIADLGEGANQVTDAAAQVSAASQRLAEGASEQASSLQETSSALEQMASMTRTNAENARQADSLSEQTRSAAQAGDQTMSRLNTAMAAINESSGQISKIIKVIEEIAFQTNLLALNAAVEAARAGEHGKGFAVVAEEVRNLAQRAAQAAGETTGLIEASVTRAREGSAAADEVAQGLSKIVTDATAVSELIAGIARASQEQAQSVEQVNMAVTQVDKVTQSNAAGAEESASAAEELSAQAATVNGIVQELAVIVHGSKGRRQATRK